MSARARTACILSGALVAESVAPMKTWTSGGLSGSSVGITARVLQDLKATRSPEGTVVLGAAILDDVLGLIVLAAVGSLVTAAATGGAGPSTWALVGILLRAMLFLALTAGLGHVFSDRFVRLVGRTGHPEAMLGFGMALCFLLAYVAELIGLAGIVGAFAAGLLIDPYGRGVRSGDQGATLRQLLHPLGGLFVPLFFVLMGARVEVASLMAPAVLGLALLLTACAVVGKLASGLGVMQAGVSRLVVGVGMIPRGEVGLIFAGIGMSLSLDGRPVLTADHFSAVVFMVLVTTVVGPIALRWTLRGPRLAR